jgi:hypothetical protein
MLNQKRKTLMTRLPSPEQWALVKMNEMETAEMIERYIDYIKVNEKTGDFRSVHLPTQFVRHYMNRDDGALPTVVAIATLPIVLADGELLAPDGLDRSRGIIFEIPKEVRAIIPGPKDCTKAAVRQAMKFLCEEWLCDVATDYTGKMHPDRRGADYHRAVATRRAASLLRYCRTPRRRQDNTLIHADHGRNWYKAGRIGVVEQ